MTRELFIYWHVPAAQADAAGAAAAAMQARLRARHKGLSARLYRRAEAPGDKRALTGTPTRTLMETYAHAGTGVGPDLQAAIEAEAATALAAWCGGGRHVEVFESESG